MLLEEDDSAQENSDDNAGEHSDSISGQIQKTKLSTI